MTKVIPIVFLILLSSCLNSKYPTKSDTFSGGLMTCNPDSTSLIIDKVVKIKQQIRTGDKKCLNCKFSDCPSKPEYFDFMMHWPSFIGLDFKKKTFYFITNPEPNNPNIKYGEKDFAVHYDVDGGKIKYDKKNKELTLSSDYYRWTRKFTYEYSTVDSTLTLRDKNGY